jgi:hypothetical protein
VTEKRSRKDIYKERLEVYNRERHLLRKVWTSVGLSTIHLLRKTEKGAPRPVGSGVLFRNGDKLFILTAAHVAEEFSGGRSAYINLPNLLLEISGQVHASVNPKSDHRDGDSLDFAVVRIDGEMARDLSTVAITAADVFNPPPGVPLGAGLAIVGFPARNFKAKGPNFYYPPTPLESHGVPEKTYQSLGLNIDDHLILQWYNTMYTSKGVVRSGSLAGMSGGGVWLVPELMGESFPPHAPWTEPKLVAIFTEHRKARSVLVATKIRHHLNKMIQQYPELPLGLRFRLVSDLLGE